VARVPGSADHRGNGLIVSRTLRDNAMQIRGKYDALHAPVHSLKAQGFARGVAEDAEFSHIFKIKRAPRDNPARARARRLTSHLLLRASA
jgi:hypothetical protein